MTENPEKSRKREGENAGRLFKKLDKPTQICYHKHRKNALAERTKG
jgi:hypothetical protein